MLVLYIYIYIGWCLLEARKCSAAQGPHSEVVPRAFWSLVSKSCDECRGSFARGCEAKRWSHWTCSSLGTIFHLMRINSVPGVKCFCNNKNVLRVQSMVWHFVRHSVYTRTTRLASKEIFSPSNKIHREVGRAKDLSALTISRLCFSQSHNS